MAQRRMEWPTRHKGTMHYEGVGTNSIDEVYSNTMKILILLCKVNADFLVAHKAVIEKDTCEVNNTVTYKSALTRTFQNAINTKFPPQLTLHRTCRIQEALHGRTGGQGRG